MFEQLVDGLFRAHGYRTETNTIVIGRSGARHEVDVLATAADELLERRVGVECKNWAQPVDTAVVARARLVRDDLGLGQMVVACPAGATPAARTTAAESGIAIWDRAELERRLGSAAVAALAPTPVRSARTGIARRTSSADAQRLVQAATRGVFGFGRGRLCGQGDAWLPVIEVRFGCGDRTGVRKRLRMRPAIVRYEALAGTPLGAEAAAIPVGSCGDDGAPQLAADLTGDALRGDLERTIARDGTLVQGAARERHAIAWETLRIPDAEVVLVEAVTTLEWPVHVAVVDDRAGLRVVVVDAWAARVDATLSECCTARLGAIAGRLGIALPAA